MYADVTKMGICCFSFPTPSSPSLPLLPPTPTGPFPKIGDWTFWVNVKHSRMGEAHGRSAAVCAACKTHLLELPTVRHGGHHLRQLLLLALQHPVHMLDWDLMAGAKNTCYRHE